MKKEYYDDDPGYVPEDYDPHDTFVDYGQDTTPTDPYYEDWNGGDIPREKTMTPEQRERYYRARDDYYARKDAYYAERDRYYAQLEQQRLRRERREWETEYYRENEEDEPRDDPALYEEPEESEPLREAAPVKEEKRGPVPRRRRKRRRLITVLILAGFVAFLATGAPKNGDDSRRRIAGRGNVLLIGTDAEGYRTDTLMLLSMDRSSNTLRLLSIPRDTYVPAYYSVPKINSAYSIGGGGESGIAELFAQLRNTLGFAPDAYLMVNLDAFVRGVDALGGVDFTVPMDMDYDDPDQNLAIHLRAGAQHLDGMQAMGLVRYRYGYANADIGRTEVQREFVQTALRQWLRPQSLAAIPELLNIYREEVMTDLTVRNILWMAIRVLRADLGEMQADVLPGYSAMIGDASCYVADSASAAPILEKISPYTE